LENRQTKNQVKIYDLHLLWGPLVPLGTGSDFGKGLI